RRAARGRGELEVVVVDLLDVIAAAAAQTADRLRRRRVDDFLVVAEAVAGEVDRVGWERHVLGLESLRVGGLLRVADRRAVGGGAGVREEKAAVAPGGARGAGADVGLGGLVDDRDAAGDPDRGVAADDDVARHQVDLRRVLGLDGDVPLGRYVRVAADVGV